MSEKSFPVSASIIVWVVSILGAALLSVAPKMFSPSVFTIYACAIGALLIALSRWGVRMGVLGAAVEWSKRGAYACWVISVISGLSWALEKLVDPALGAADTAYMGSLVMVVIAMWLSYLLPFVIGIAMVLEFSRE